MKMKINLLLVVLVFCPTPSYAGGLPRQVPLLIQAMLMTKRIMNG